MRTINDTITRLSAYRGLAGSASFPPGQDRLSELSAFGTNPGQLRARCYVPDDLPANAPLLVVLHGCTQTAAGYDHGSGWSRLADAHGFALLFPEQQRSNNANLCFNWFEPVDVRRGHGEVLSIRQMTAAMVAAHQLDDARLYVTGLSAGGAMAAALLAAYPEIFAGGAIIAGIASGSAATMPEAFDRMRGHAAPAAAELARRTIGAGKRTHWPVVSVWTGDADRTVDASNARLIAEQWLTLHGLHGASPVRDTIDGCRRERWTGPDGRVCVELVTVPGMGHGTPIDPDAIGASMPFMLTSGISSTHRIAELFALAPPAAPTTARAVKPRPLVAAPAAAAPGIAETIDSALRAAGLRR